MLFSNGFKLNKKKKGRQLGATVLFIRYRVGHYYGFLKLNSMI